MTTQHTPGPWKESAMAELRRILHAEDECHPGLTCTDEIMDQHNAMLNALREIADLLQRHQAFQRGNDTVHYCAHKALSAIAKAEG